MNEDASEQLLKEWREKQRREQMKSIINGPMRRKSDQEFKEALEKFQPIKDKSIGH